MAIEMHIDTNAEEKMINLRKKRELLLDKAEKYTRSMIDEKADWYDSLLDDLVINYAVRQNAKIRVATYGVIVLENYIENRIINELAKRIFNDLKIDNRVNDSYECIFDLELMGVIKDTLKSIFDAKMIKKGFIKKNIRLSSNYYFLLPPNCMDEYVHIWVSESLNVGLFLFKEYPFAIKKQLLELLVIEKSERDKRNNDK